MVGTCINLMKTVLFCVFYNVANFTYSAEEISQTKIRIVGKGRSCISVSVKRFIPMYVGDPKSKVSNFFRNRKKHIFSIIDTSF